MIKFALVFTLILQSVLAAEVTILEPLKSDELLFTTTDSVLQASLEKEFLAHPCRLSRSAQNLQVPVREIYFPRICRVQVIKYLLNQGLKADQFHVIFTKP